MTVSKTTVRKSTGTKALAKKRRMESKKKVDKHQLTPKEKKTLSAVNDIYKHDCALHDCLVDICGNYESILENKKITKMEMTEALEQFTSELSHTINEFGMDMERRHDKLKRYIEKE